MFSMCRSLSIPLLASVVLPGAALAQPGSFTITETRSSAGTCGGDVIVHGPYSSGQDPTIGLSVCAERINIVASNSGVNIGRITFTGGPTTFALNIILGNSATINTQDILGTVVGNDWEGLVTSGMSTPSLARD